MEEEGAGYAVSFEEPVVRSPSVLYWDPEHQMEEEGDGYAVSFEEPVAHSPLVLYSDSEY